MSGEPHLHARPRPVREVPRNETDTLADLLDAVHELLTRFVAFPSPETADAVAAWVIHAHLLRLGAFDSTPRLALLSPEKGSGKTRVLEVLALLVPQALHTVNTSAAALFRLVEKQQPTMLMDECDTYLGPRISKEHEDVRGLVNAGHRRGAVAVRCVGEGGKIDVKEFSAFCPVALAGLGDLPDTIMQRSIIVAMKRRRPDEVVQSFRARLVEPLGHAVRARVASWTEAHWDELNGMEVAMPNGVADRPADVWEPLLVIGDAAGIGWSRRVRCACSTLTAASVAQDASLGVRLLADIRHVFDRSKLHTTALLERLNALDDSPWGDLRGKQLDPRRLAKMLKPYGVFPTDQRIGERVAKGYDRTDFTDAWQRYLRAPEQSATSATNDPV